MRTLMVAVLCLFTFSTYAQVAPFTGPATWNNYAALPQYEEWAWMYADAEDIATDLNNGDDKYYLEYKTSGGSSHQTLVKRKADGHTMGIWSAPNHATYITGEIFPFNLARLLGHSDRVTPGTRMTLTGPGRDMAYSALNYSGTIKSRLCNRDTMLAYMNANPYYVTGAYMAFRPNEKPVTIHELGEPTKARTLNMNHFLVKMIYADGPRPTGRPVYLIRRNGRYTLSYDKDNHAVGVSDDLTLAKELSFMMLIDALNSQRDRLDGSNMEALLRTDGTFTLAAVDNGGIDDVANTVSLKFFLGLNTNGRAVSRLERHVIDQIIALDDFIQGKTWKFLNFNSPEELKYALGYEEPDTVDVKLAKPAVCSYNYTYLFYSTKTRWTIRYRNFVNALKQVAAHLRTLRNNPNAHF